MTPNQIISRAKAKLRTNTSNIEWDMLFAEAIDIIFGEKPWKFARREINYIHSQQTFEKQFSDTSDELALNKIASAYYATSYAVVGGAVVPTGGTVKNLEYCPYATFNRLNPDHTLNGNPDILTIIRDNDGTNGMQIGIFRRPVADISIWIYGDFIPSYTINDNPLPILPLQFHRLVYYIIVHLAAIETGQDKLAGWGEKMYAGGLVKLDNWDRS